MIFNKKQVSISILILSGIIFRIREFFFNRPLWLDESFLALNITEKSLPELIFNHLSYLQHAPIVYIFFIKIINIISGNSEYSLRLFSLLCSLISIFVFYKLVLKIFNFTGVCFSLFFFTFSLSLIYYSSETKQYSFDLLITLLLVSNCFLLTKDKLNNSELATISIFTIASIWCSFNSPFILSGMLIILFLHHSLNKNKTMLLQGLVITSLTSLSFYIYHNHSLYKITENKYLFKIWDWAFITFPPNEKTIELITKLFQDVFSNASFIAIFYFTVGLISLFFAKNKIIYLLILSPLIFITSASLIKIYPFYERFLFFIHPIIIIVVSKGIEFTLNGNNKIIRLANGLLVLIFILLFISSSVSNFINPCIRNNIKGVLYTLKKNIMPGDLIYIHHLSQYPFKYYGHKYGFNTEYSLLNNYTGLGFTKPFNEMPRFISKPGFNDIFLGRISQYSLEYPFQDSFEPSLLKGKKRVWILISHRLHERNEFYKNFDKVGKRTKSFYSFGHGFYGDKNLDYASLDLYDFSN